MMSYPGLGALIPNSEEAFAAALPRIIHHLADAWLSEYEGSCPENEVVEVSNNGFSHLFDVASGRLLAAWTVSEGAASHARDKGRMRGHPLSAGAHYHRGHAIPHSLGGGTDINLVAQLGSVNTGAFRPLEIEAVNSPGALYFTHWRYRAVSSVRPSSVEQGLIKPGAPPDIRGHAN